MKPGGSARSGMSLIAVLAVLAVLTVLVMVCARLLSHADNVWSLGSGELRLGVSGRTALQRIAHDLEHAIADTNLNLTFVIRPDTEVLSYGAANSEVGMLSLQHDAADGTRAVREVRYWVAAVSNAGGDAIERYDLIRSEVAATNAYSDPSWYAAGRPACDPAVVAENVALFRLQAGTGPEPPLDPAYNSESHGRRLPRYVDVLLELLPDRETRQARTLSRPGALPAGEFAAWLDRRVRRFTTRVAFPNREGYKQKF
jgi:hypothetical protein